MVDLGSQNLGGMAIPHVSQNQSFEQDSFPLLRVLSAFGASAAKAPDERKWNTSILAERAQLSVTSSAERFFIEPRAPTAREFYENFIATQTALGALVSHEESDTYVAARQALDWILQRAGYDRDRFKLDIIRSPEDNAFILHADGIEAPHIFITTGFLEGLAEKLPSGLREGHLRKIFGHEVAHFKEGHYEQVKTREASTPASADPLKVRSVWGRVDVALAKDQLLALAFTRDQELKVDEIALRWCADPGASRERVSPLEGVEVLDYIAEQSAAAKEHDKENYSKTRKRFPLLSWAARALTSTHPGTFGRAARGRGVVRQIEIERSVESNPSASRRLWRETAKLPDLRRDRQLNPSSTQEMLADLDKVVKQSNPINRGDFAHLEKFVRSRTDRYGPENYHLALNEIRHLALFVATYIRVENRCAPFEPYDAMRPLGHDRSKALLTQDLPRESAAAMATIFGHLRETIERLLDLSLQSLNADGAPDSKAIADVTLGAYFALAGIYRDIPGGSQAANWGNTLLYEQVLPALQRSPEAAAELINRHGRQYFDFRAVSWEWARPLLEADDAKVSERGEWFAALVQSESVDLRPELFNNLLANGLLDTIENLNEMVAFIVQIERLFAQEPAWHEREMAHTLGGEVALWLSSRFAAEDRLQDQELQSALLALRQRESAPRNGADYILIESSRICLAAEAGSREQRTNWLVNTFEAGLNRDLLLCTLIEEETALFHKFKTRFVQTESSSGQDEVVAGEQGEKRSATRPSVKVEIIALPVEDQLLVAEVVGALLEYFDCHWIETEIHRGNMAYIHDESTLVHPLGSKDHAADSLALSKAQSAIAQLPLYSSLLFHFTLTQTYDVSGPYSREVNTLRHYICTFLEISLLALEHKRPPKPLPRSHPDLHKKLAHGALYKFAAELRPGTEFKHRLSASKLAAHAADIASARGEVNIFERAAYLTNSKLSEQSSELKKLPEGEFRDYLVLRALSKCLLRDCLKAGHKVLRAAEEDGRLDSTTLSHLCRAIEMTSAAVKTDGISLIGIGLDSESNFILPYESLSLTEIKELLAMLRSPKSLASTAKLTLSSSSSENAFRLELLGKLYRDYPLYLRVRSGSLDPSAQSSLPQLTFFNLPDVATEVARLAVQRFHGNDKESVAAFQALTPSEKLAEIESLFIYPSAERDAHLMRILDEAALASSACYREALAARTYDLLLSPYYRAAVGEKIYESTSTADPSLVKDFDRHLDLILATHPPNSARREQRLKNFFDGKRGQIAASVRTWAQREKVKEHLLREAGTTADEEILIRKGGLQMIQAAINEIELPPKEHVETVLWMAGLRDKSHLVNCYEAATGSDTGALENELSKLTDEEKRELIKTVLVGPQGILKSDDIAAKKEFLDTLFFSVFRDASEQRTTDNVRYFKAVYDTMLHHIEPERAADFLGNFLVAHLQGESFNSQVKVFFESFGFVGIKTAQYLVSSTTMIPNDMKEALMDLTSRVEGPNKDFVFEMAEKTYGDDAKRIIAEVGDWVGGGSLMSFYEVTLTDGREGVIGVLRPDIVHALPEDIVLVHRLIETMQEAPEIFGGNTVSMDLNDNLVYMSLVETNLQRTAKLQTRMKREIEDLAGEVAVHVPEMWTHIRLPGNDADGETRNVQLTKGPFIFMEKARGDTLDLFLKKCAAGDEEEQSQAKKALNKVADVFLDQVSTHGLVHCDLHPGNILVYEIDGRLHVTFLDIGLSIELKPEVQKPLERYLRIAVGRTDFGEGSGAFGQAFRKLLGVGEIEEAKGKRWIRESVDLFEQLVGEQWDDELRERATNVLWELTTRRDVPVQKKLSQVMELSRELGLRFPREFYYIVRAVSVMGYVWEVVDWRRQAHRFRSMGEGDADESSIPPINVDLVTEKIITAAERIDLPLQRAEVAQIFVDVNAEHELPKRIEILRRGLSQLGEGHEDQMHELIQCLTDDMEFREEIGLENVAQKLQQFFSVQAGDQIRTQRHDFGFLAAEPLPPGMAREIAYENRFGQLSSVWRSRFSPGTPLRIATAEGKVEAGYVVLPYNLVHDAPEQLELGRFPAAGVFRPFTALAASIFGKIGTPQSGPQTDSWSRVFSAMDRYLYRLGQVTGPAAKLSHYHKRNLASGVGDNPFEFYRQFFDIWTDPALTRDTVTLERLVRNCAKSPAKHIEVMIEAEWKTLDDCLVQAGESPHEYLRFMTELRRDLGFGPQ